jgi:antitoxin component of MazEF toxin-antitoxin module
MNRYKATIIRTGNSYALRVPKRYVEDADLAVGEKVEIALPLRQVKQDRQRIAELFGQLQQSHAYHDIKDPIAWQKELRRDRPLPGRDSYGAT